MSDDPRLARFMQEVFLAEERCLAAEPCGSNECAACIYGEGVRRTLVPRSWAGLGSWSFDPKDTTVKHLTLDGRDSFGASE